MSPSATMTLSALAEMLGSRLQGPDKPFTGLNSLERATSSEVSFLSNPKYASKLAETRAAAVIVSPEYADAVSTALISDNPYRDFARAAALFVKPHYTQSDISELAHIDPTATIGEGCVVHPYAFVAAGAVVGDESVLFPGVYVGMGAKIGERCMLFPNAVVMAEVTIGDDCVLQAGAVLGTDGFGFVRYGGIVQKIPQIGTVVLGDGVDVGANSCVDRATVGATRVDSDTKIDNLVQVGHNVTVGEQSFLISQAGIAGSTKVGKRVTIAGQAGLAGHLSIGDDVTIGPQAGVAKDLPAGAVGSGSPFMDYNLYLRSSILVSKLPEMSRKIKELEKQLRDLSEQLAVKKEENNDN